MKRFLTLTLIYSINVILFLFAKSAGAVTPDNLQKGRAPAVLSKLDSHGPRPVILIKRKVAH